MKSTKSRKTQNFFFHVSEVTEMSDQSGDAITSLFKKILRRSMLTEMVNRLIMIII